MEPKLNFASASAILSGMIPLLGLTPGDPYALIDCNDLTVASLGDEMGVPILASNQHGHAIVGPLTADQTYVLRELGKVRETVGIIYAEAETVPEFCVEYEDGGEAVLADANIIDQHFGDINPNCLSGMFGCDCALDADLFDQDEAVTFDFTQAPALSDDDFAAKMDEILSPENFMPERGDILWDAAETVVMDRNDQYGEPEDNLAQIALHWSLIAGANITPEQVALMMVALKIVRTGNGYHRDNYVDMAGYAALAGEAALNAHTSPTVH